MEWISKKLDGEYEFNSWELIEDEEFEKLVLEHCVVDFEKVFESIYRKIEKSVSKQEEASDAHKYVHIKLALLEKCISQNLEKVKCLNPSALKEKISLIFQMSCSEVNYLISSSAVHECVKILQVLSDSCFDIILQRLHERLMTESDSVEEDPIHTVQLNVIKLRKSNIVKFLEQMHKSMLGNKEIRSTLLWKINRLILEWCEEFPDELKAVFDSSDSSLDAIVNTWIDSLDTITDNKNHRSYGWPLMSCFLFLSRSVLQSTMKQHNSKGMKMILSVKRKLADIKSVSSVCPPLYSALIVSQMASFLDISSIPGVLDYASLCTEKIKIFFRTTLKTPKSHLSEDSLRFMDDILVTLIRLKKVDDLKLEEFFSTVGAIQAQNIIIKSFIRIVKKKNSRELNVKDSSSFSFIIVDGMIQIIQKTITNNKSSTSSLCSSSSISSITSQQFATVKRSKKGLLTDEGNASLINVLRFIHCAPELTMQYCSSSKSEIKLNDLFNMLIMLLTVSESSNVVSMCARVVIEFHSPENLRLWMNDSNSAITIKLVNLVANTFCQKKFSQAEYEAFVTWCDKLIQLRGNYMVNEGFLRKEILLNDLEHITMFLYLCMLRNDRKLLNKVLKLFGRIGLEMKLSKPGTMEARQMCEHFCSLAILANSHEADNAVYHEIWLAFRKCTFYDTTSSCTFEFALHFIKEVTVAFNILPYDSSKRSRGSFLITNTINDDYKDKSAVQSFRFCMNFVVSLGESVINNNKSNIQIFDELISLITTVLTLSFNHLLFAPTLLAVVKYMRPKSYAHLLPQLYAAFQKLIFDATSRKSIPEPEKPDSTFSGKVKSPVVTPAEHENHMVLSCVKVLTKVVTAILERVEDLTIFYDSKLKVVVDDLVKIASQNDLPDDLKLYLMTTFDLFLMRSKDFGISDNLLLKRNLFCYIMDNYKEDTSNNNNTINKSPARKSTITSRFPEATVLSDSRRSTGNTPQKTTSISPQAVNLKFFKILNKITIDFSLDQLRTALGDDSKVPKFFDLVTFMLTAVVQQKFTSSDPNSLSGNAIGALSNLLMANIEIGLSRVIEICSYSKCDIELVVLEVLKMAVRSGQRLKMADDKTNSVGYQNVQKILCNPSESPKFPTLDAMMRVAYNTCSHSKRQKVFLYSVQMLAEENLLIDYLRYCFNYQAVQDKGNDMFRRESQYIFLMTVCLQWFGETFIRLLVNPVLCFWQEKMSAVPKKGADSTPLAFASTREIGPKDALPAFFISLRNCMHCGIPTGIRMVFNLLRTSMESVQADLPIFRCAGIFTIRILASALNGNNASNKILKLFSPLTQEIQNINSDLMKRTRSPDFVSKYKTEYLDTFKQFAHQLSTFTSKETVIVDKNPQTTILFCNAAKSIMMKIEKEISGNNLEIDEALKKLILSDISQIGTACSKIVDDVSVYSARQSYHTSKSKDSSSYEYSFSRDQDVKSSIFDDVFFKFQKNKLGQVVYYLIPGALNTMSVNRTLIYRVVNHLKVVVDTMQFQDWALTVDLAGFNSFYRVLIDTVLDEMGTWSKDVVKYLKVVYIINSNSESHTYAIHLHRTKGGLLKKLNLKYIQFINNFDEFINMENIPSQKLYFLPVRPAENQVNKCTVNKTKGCEAWASSDTLVIQRAAICPFSSSNIYLYDTYKYSTIKNMSNDTVSELVVFLPTGSVITIISDTMSQLIKQMCTCESLRICNKSINKSSVNSVSFLLKDEIPGSILISSLCFLLHRRSEVNRAAFQLFDNFVDEYKLKEYLQLSACYINWMPERHVEFVYGLSEILAKRERYWTMGVISSGVSLFKNFDERTKSLVLPIFRPWMENFRELVSEVNGDDVLIFKTILDEIVQMTRKNLRILEEINVNLWEPVSSSELLVKLATKTIIMHGVLFPNDPNLIEALTTITMSLSKCHKLVMGTIFMEHIHHMIFVIDKFEEDCDQSAVFQSQISWTHVEILMKFFCSLTFYDRADVRKTLPLLVYVSMIYIAIFKGSANGVCSALMNTLLHVQRNDSLNFSENTKSLLSYQTSYIDSQFDHYIKCFLGSDRHNSTWMYLRNVATSIASFFQACDEDNSTLNWFEEWTKILKICSKCDHHQNLQSFTIFLRCCTSPTVDDEIFTDIFTFSSKCDITNVGEHFNIHSIFYSFLVLMHKVTTMSERIYDVFWFCVGCLTLSFQPLYLSALSLLERLMVLIVNSLETGQKLDEVLMSYRLKRVDMAFCRLEDQVGISFKKSFNYAFASILAKAFHHPNNVVRSLSKRLIKCMVDYHASSSSSNTQSCDMLPYLTMLITHSDDLCKNCFKNMPLYRQVTGEKFVLEAENIIESFDPHSMFDDFAGSSDIFSKAMSSFSLVCMLSITIDQMISETSSALSSTEQSGSDVTSEKSSSSSNRSQKHDKTDDSGDKDSDLQICIVLEAMSYNFAAFPEFSEMLSSDVATELNRLFKIGYPLHVAFARLVLKVINKSKKKLASSSKVKDADNSKSVLPNLNNLLDSYNFFGFKAFIGPFSNDVIKMEVSQHYKKLCTLLSYRSSKN